MEIGDEHLDNLIVVARRNDNLRGAVEDRLVVSVVPRQQVLQSLQRRNAGRLFVRFPLVDMKVVGREIGVAFKFQTHIIEALECADTGGSDGYCLAIVCQQALDGVAMDGNVLRVHRVVADGLAFDRSEGASADVQRDFLALDATGVDVAQDTIGEVETGRRSRHAAFNLRIDGLIGRLVALLCLAVQIRRNGQFAHHVDDFSETDRGKR